MQQATDFQYLRESILQILERERQTNPQSYQNFKNAGGRPYQAYERIGFEGLRWSVEKRIKEYGLRDFLGPDVCSLDIGSNYGFFTVEFALHCKESHGVEPVAELCDVGRITAKAVGVDKNTRFFPSTFENFVSPITYDFVTSLAAFFTSDGVQRTEAVDYFQKIYGMMTKKGFLFYESTSYQKDPDKDDFNHYEAMLDAVAAIEFLFSVKSVWETRSGATYLRTFVIAQKI